MQVIKDIGVGGSLGQAFGQGLRELAENKIQKMQQRATQDRAMRAYEGLGYSKEEARALSMLPEKVQMQYLKEYGPSSRSQDQQNDRQIPSESFQQRPDEMNMFGEQQQGEDNTQGILNALSNLNPKNLEQEMIQNQVARFLSPEQNQELFQRYMEDALGKQPQAQAQKTAQIAPEIQQKGAIKEVAPLKPQAQQSERRLSKSQEAAIMAEEKKIRDQNYKESREEEKRIQAETLPVWQKLEAERDLANFSEPRLNKLEAMVKKGGLPISTIHNVIKSFEDVNPAAGAAAGAYLGSKAGPYGAVVGGLAGGLVKPVASMLESAEKFFAPNTDEFTALANDFVRGAKEIFGARLTDQDLKTFLSMIPSLSQTDAGKLAIINNMRVFNKAGKIRYKNAEKIVKENGGKRPQNLSTLVDEYSKDEIDKLMGSWQDSESLMDKSPALKSYGLSQQPAQAQEKSVDEMSDWDKTKRLFGY